MFLKKQFIKNYLKVQVVGQDVGVLRIRIPNLKNVDDQYKGFESDVKDLFMLLPGLTDIQTNFNTGNISIFYDSNQLTPRQVALWINTVIDTAIDHFDFIRKNWDSNPELVKATLTMKLKQKIK